MRQAEKHRMDPKVASTFGSDAPANLPSESHTLARRGGPAAFEGT